MGYEEHHQRAEHETPRRIPCGVVTVSDTRTPESDLSGRIIIDRLKNAGHDIRRYEVATDDAPKIVALVQEMAAGGCALILLNGGTGISRRDSTFEAVDALLEKRLPGFGELFRMLSFQEIGAAAMLSRATAGTLGNALVFSLPGSPNAVQLGMDRLIMPELAHLVWETIRQGEAR